MTRKDFELIAMALLRVRARPNLDNLNGLDAVDDVIDGLARVLATTNPRFDRAKFLQACGR
jgi:hypothetical protein